MSPLGRYSQIVAAFVAVVVIAGAVVMHAMGRSDTFVDSMALLALGAVFGASAATATTNGAIKAEVDAVHARLDQAHIPAGADATTPQPGPPA